MTIEVVSDSNSFIRHLKRISEDQVITHSELNSEVGDVGDVVLIQVSGQSKIDQQSEFNTILGKGKPIAIGSDQPSVSEMLNAVDCGARSYFSTHMQAVHYQQMIRLLQNDQSWFPPELLSSAFSLAQQSINGKDNSSLLSPLTDREKEIAVAVSDGKSNREIGEVFDISERTVKAHLTNIFAKLEIKDRVGLVLYLK